MLILFAEMKHDGALGLFSGQIAVPTLNTLVSEPQNTGESTMRMIAAASPPYMLHTAPRVVKLRQNSEYRMVGRLADAATAKASATRNATF